MSNQPKMQRYGLGAGVALLIVAAAAIAFQLIGGRESGLGPLASEAFYTDDNGKTFFKDDINNLTPFTRDGKQAYRCDVFEGAGGNRFVGLVYRATESGKKEMEAYLKIASKDSDGSTRRELEARCLEVKPVAAPDKAWQIGDDTAVARLRSGMNDPSGKPAKLIQP